MARKLTAHYRREGADWIVQIGEERRCHTFGRDLEQARRSIREAASLWFDGELELDEVFEPSGESSAPDTG